MTELEEKIWNLVHGWCNGQYHEIPDQNRRDLMDRVKALIDSIPETSRGNVTGNVMG